MITEIQLINFQNHSNTLLKLSPNINVISGSSDQGKTSIHRAIYWVVFNKPLGDAFMKDGESQVSVIIKTEKHTIERTKSSSKNYYKIDGVQFNALRTEVPEEVNKILGISPTNIQLQLEQHFLLSSTGGEVAKAINAVADLGEIDTATSSINKTYRGLRDKRAFLEETIKKKEDQLNYFNGINDLDKQATELADFIEKEKQLDQDITAGEVLLEKINDFYQVQKICLDFQYKLKNRTKDIKKITKDVSMSTDQIEEIEKVISRIIKTKASLHKFNNVPSLSRDITIIIALEEKVDIMWELIDNIIIAESNLRLKEERLIDYKNTLEKSIIKKNTIEKELTNCPWCNTKFGGKSK